MRRRRADARVCETGLRIAPRVTESLVAYDHARRTLTYEGAGLPSFVTLARNRWRVIPLSETRCVMRLDATLELRGAPARTIAPALRLQFRREARRLTRDLKHYAEQAEVSPRKRATAGRTRPRAHTDET